MTTKTDFHAVKELEAKYTPKVWGIVDGEESRIIREVLEVAQRNDIELQNIRDMVVMLYGGWADSMREKSVGITTPRLGRSIRSIWMP